MTAAPVKNFSKRREQRKSRDIFVYKNRLKMSLDKKENPNQSGNIQPQGSSLLANIGPSMGQMQMNKGNMMMQKMPIQAMGGDIVSAKLAALANLKNMGGPGKFKYQGGGMNNNMKGNYSKNPMNKQNQFQNSMMNKPFRQYGNNQGGMKFNQGGSFYPNFSNLIANKKSGMNIVSMSKNKNDKDSGRFDKERRRKRKRRSGSDSRRSRSRSKSRRRSKGRYKKKRSRRRSRDE